MAKHIALMILISISITNVVIKAEERASELQVKEWIKGEPLKISASKGKTILLVFWSTWSHSAKQCIPQLNNIQTQYMEKDTIVIGISNESRQVVEKYVNDNHIKFRIALDNNNKTFTTYLNDIITIPTAFIIGKDGNILWHGHPSECDNFMIEEILSGRFDLERHNTICQLRNSITVSMGRNRKEETLTNVDKLLTLFPEDEQAIDIKLYFFTAEKNLKGAIAFLDSLIKRCPNSLKVRYKKLNILQSNNSPSTEIEKCAGEIFKLCEKKRQDLIYLAWFLFEMDKDVIPVEIAFNAALKA